MKKRNHYKLGILLLFAYCIVYSFSQVATEYYEHIRSAYVLAPYVFLIAILVFLFITRKNYKETYKLASGHKSLIIKINVTTALGWLTIIYALQFIQPVAALMISFGILPASTVVLSYFNDQVAKPTKMDFILASVMLIIISITAIINILIDWHAVLAVIFCLIAGVANSYNTIYAKILLQNQFNNWQILSLRFYIAFTLAAVIAVISHAYIVPNLAEMATIILISVTTVVVPAYLIQMGVDFSDAIALSFIVPLSPLITFFLELFNPHIHFSLIQFILVIFMVITIFLATLYKLRYR